MRKGTPVLAAAFFSMALFLPAGAFAECPLPTETFLQAVALYDGDALARMENKNRLPELCPPTPDYEPAEFVCKQDALDPEDRHIPLYDAPEGAEIGKITVTYAPGDAITAKVTLEAAKDPLPYLPAVYTSDWGYGPWFHATLLDRRGDWLRIPVPTLPTAWIHLPGADIISLAGNELDFFLDGDSHIALRNNPGDLGIRDATGEEACCGGTPPENPAWRTLDRKDVYGGDCELRLLPACPHGC